MTRQKRDMTKLKLVWPVNMTGHHSKIIWSPASGSVMLGCIVYYPISVTSRFWMFDISQLKRLCQAFLCNSPLPLPSC